MAKWDSITERGDVEDRRWTRMIASAGGIGITGILLVLAVWYFGGQDQALNLFDQLTQQPTQTQTTDTSGQYDGVDSYEKFVSEVLGSTDTLWSNAIQTYHRPKLVLFRGATSSACGWAESAVGPHYCNMDQTIYLDETFFDDLSARFWARGWDVAEWYVIAHEVGHHVQDELGIIDQVHTRMQTHPSEQSALSVALELQADCLAGIWAGTLQWEGIITQNEMSEAIDAAWAVWDDRIQKMTTWHVNPETWTHGSSVDRKKWLGIGYAQKNFESCNTFWVAK